jgi:hypothetical protein
MVGEKKINYNHFAHGKLMLLRKEQKEQISKATEASLLSIF